MRRGGSWERDEKVESGIQCGHGQSRPCASCHSARGCCSGGALSRLVCGVVRKVAAAAAEASCLDDPSDRRKKLMMRQTNKDLHLMAHCATTASRHKACPRDSLAPRGLACIALKWWGLPRGNGDRLCTNKPTPRRGQRRVLDDARPILKFFSSLLLCFSSHSNPPHT